jgi:hypothetical protein
MEAFFGEITPIMIMAVVVGLVEIIRQVVDGEKLSWKFYAALFIGLGLGGVYHIVNISGAITARDGFNAVIYGLLCGLTPTGLYGAVQRIARGSS